MIESILLCALFVYGVKAVIDGYAWFFDWNIERFYEWQDPLENPKTNEWTASPRPKWQQFILKPTIYCNVCMSSFWGSVYFWSMYYENDQWFIYWPLHMVCSAAIITLFNKIPE
jgi:hypothetical protein